jgi:hypothetical protein
MWSKGRSLMIELTDTEIATEKHFSTREVAELWGIADTTVRQLFRNEQDVMRIAREDPNKRRYTSLRIPQSALARLHRELRRPPHTRDNRVAREVK